MNYLKKVFTIIIIAMLLIIFSTYIIIGGTENTYNASNTDLFVICGFNYNNGKIVKNIKYDLDDTTTLETKERSNWC